MIENIEQRVVEAYKATGLKAAPYTMVPIDGACCGLGALKAQVGRHYTAEDNPGPGDAADLFGGDRANAWAFAQGFDFGLTFDEEYDRAPESVSEAYMAGFRAARAVIEAGLRVSEEE